MRLIETEGPKKRNKGRMFEGNVSLKYSIESSSSKMDPSVTCMASFPLADGLSNAIRAYTWAFNEKCTPMGKDIDICVFVS